MNENGKDFAVTDLLSILWMNKFLIITLACLVATGFLVKTVYFTEPQYVADGMLYVSNKDDLLLQDRIQQSDIFSSRTLSETYIEILQSRSFLSDVSNATGAKYSWEEIKSMTKISSVNETELLSIVPDDSPILLIGELVVQIFIEVDCHLDVGKSCSGSKRLGFLRPYCKWFFSLIERLVETDAVFGSVSGEERVISRIHIKSRILCVCIFLAKDPDLL